MKLIGGMSNDASRLTPSTPTRTVRHVDNDLGVRPCNMVDLFHHSDIVEELFQKMGDIDDIKRIVIKMIGGNTDRSLTSVGSVSGLMSALVTTAFSAATYEKLPVPRSNILDLIMGVTCPIIEYTGFLPMFIDLSCSTVLSKPGTYLSDAIVYAGSVT